MHEQTDDSALARFLSGDTAITAEEVAEIERSVRELSWEVSSFGNGPRVKRGRSVWPWKNGRRAS